MVHRSTIDDTRGLSTAATEAFVRDGVIVLENFVSAAQCDTLKQRALELVAEYAPAASGTVFSTRDNRHAKDAYFEASANGIGVFFEEGALDDAGKLQVPLEKAVNKIGHAMHDLDPVFNAFSRGHRLQAVADGIGLIDPKLVQSMYIFKQPGIGGEVVCHQDSTFLYTEPQSVVGFWFAIEDAHHGNGCLGGLAGEHHRGLRQIYSKHADGQLRLDTIQPDLAWDMNQIEWLEVPKGTLILFSGEFPHLSEPNRSAVSRHAYTLHAVSGRAHYPSGNWIQRPAAAVPFRGFI
jgi:phytanoyl-CoA hydroxylase